MTARGCFDWEWITFVADNMMWLFPVAIPVFRALRRKRATPTQLMMDTLRDTDGRAVFQSFLVKEWAVESLKFWEEAGERPRHDMEDFLLNSVKDVWGELRIVGLGVPKYGSHFAQRSVRHVDWEHGVGTQKRLVNDVALPVQSMRVR